MRTFVRIMFCLAMCVASAQTVNAQGDNMCPRGVYVSIHAAKDVGGKLKDLVDDPTFTIGTFLNTFGNFFSSSRLVLKPSTQPEYSLTVTFVQVKGRMGSSDRSFMGIVLGFIGGEIQEYESITSFSGKIDERLFYSGAVLLEVITEANGFDPASHIPLVQAELSKQKSIDDIIVAYEQIPISATVDDDPWCGYDPSNPNPYPIDFKEFKTALPPNWDVANTHPVRLIAKAEKGLIENGDFIKEDHMAKVFTLGKANFITLNYRPPDGPDQSDTITLYNSCEIRYVQIVPLNETKKNTKIAEMKVNCKERWNVELTFTKTMSGKEQLGEGGRTRQVGGSYSATVKAVVEYVKSEGSDRIFESKSAELDLNDTFWQHLVLQSGDLTCEGRISWTGTHNGKIQVPVIMKIHTRAKQCSFGFGRPGGDPIPYKMAVNLWGDDRCGGARAWNGESQVKDVLFSASGVDAEHLPKPIPFSPGQKGVSGQDQWNSTLWLVRSWGALSVPIEQFPALWRPMLTLLKASSLISKKIPANMTLSWKATKLGQKD
jgi:hypothetical protein